MALFCFISIKFLLTLKNKINYHTICKTNCKNSPTSSTMKGARKEAEKIVADARKEAEELRTRVENDIRMASSQAISSVRQRIENIIISKAVSADVKKSLEDPELIRSLLTTVAGAFNAADAAPAGLEAVLPASMQESLREYFKKNASDI